ncbi:PAAR motif protein [Streptomyces spinoverrucosus]|uniref:PAAR motif protein n=1 Tax=Streptomyces spinoverrucosus TaxID=284043 RepID=A0A4Y3VV64_9ACTN|nr:PAAR domain-containing protein [Streptomyces spinoverrucosus]GEC09560.1 PAAR motif protein [Streptomyces spinoverrucosus]GHB95943.1 PAAR motif protein [Streptomyces spinoverrucosus]
MSLPAAKQGDRVVGVDQHIVLVPTPVGTTVPTVMPMPFSGTLTAGCCANVLISGRPAAVVGSRAVNSPPHLPPPTPPGAVFSRPPDNSGTVSAGSATVLIGGKPAARHGDTVMTCNDPVPAPKGKIIATGNVVIG